MNTSVDLYFVEGCGRCPLGGTAACKVHNWEPELAQLRRIILECGLTEECKWGVPCYTFQHANILMLAAFKEYCSISFFKGSLLQDAEGILRKQGENVQAGRLIRFTALNEVQALEAQVKAYIFEAIEVERAGLKVAYKQPGDFEIPEEFQGALDGDPVLKEAFESLTPGRQRGYLLHFSAPKQSKTRESRIEKCIPRILEGRGMQD